MKIKIYYDLSNSIRVKWIFRKRKAAFASMELLIAVIMIGMLAAILAYWGTIIYVAHHFIAKYW